MAMSRLYIMGILLLSVTISVSIVVFNKVLMSTYGFQFGSSLSGWHMAFTYLTLNAAARLGWFETKTLPRHIAVGFGFLNGASVGFLNLSLGFNSVGFYQMTKLAIIPFTVLLQTIFFGVSFSLMVQLSLLLLLLGVGVATVTDVELNFVGTILSLLAILATCLSQIFNNTFQSRLQVSSTQLLHQSVPYMALSLLVSGPFLDYLLTSQNVFHFKYTGGLLGCILFSCILAALVNFMSFMVIGLTSPVTYQVLGHLKTCLILSFGYIMFATPFRFWNVAGLLIAVLGMVLYSHLKSAEAPPKQSTSPPADPLLPGERERDRDSESALQASHKESSAARHAGKQQGGGTVSV